MHARWKKRWRGMKLLSADQSLDVEDGPLGINSSLVLSSLTNEPFGVGESNPGRSNTVALVIGNYFNMTILVNTNTRVGGTKIYPYHRSQLGCGLFFFSSGKQRK